MTEGEKTKRPEFVNDVRVRAPEDYDFNTWGTPFITKERTSRSTTNSPNLGRMLFGKRNN